jgi:hypothetical protein
LRATLWDGSDRAALGVETGSSSSQALFLVEAGAFNDEIAAKSSAEKAPAPIKDRRRARL